MPPWGNKTGGAERSAWYQMVQDCGARAFMLGVLAIAFARIVQEQSMRIAFGNDSWLIGDWLISYAAGIVRRGAFGSALSQFGSYGFDELSVLWGFQTLLYVAMFGIVAKWILQLPDSRRLIPLFLSPAFLLFSVYDFQGSHRKEIIGLAGFFILVDGARRSAIGTKTLLVSLLLFGIGSLSHEINALMAPAYAVVILMSFRDSKISPPAAYVSILSIVAFFAASLGLSLTRPGTTAQANAICLDLIARGYDASVCGGAISYIGLSSADAVRSVAEMFPNQLWYGLAGILALIPLALYSWARVEAFTLVSVSSPFFLLYFLGMDWGRWIMAQVAIATALLVLLSERRNQRIRVLPLPIVLLFVFAWRLPHYGIDSTFIGPNRFAQSILYNVSSILSFGN